MRRRNRQMKMMLDIPECYKDEDGFMRDFMNVLDNNEWKLNILEDGTAAAIHSVQLGEFLIEPEEGDD